MHLLKSLMVLSLVMHSNKECIMMYVILTPVCPSCREKSFLRSLIYPTPRQLPAGGLS